MTPLQCLRSVDFWVLFAINGICSGAGLTLLNNVGQQVGAGGQREQPAVMLMLHCADQKLLQGRAAGVQFAYILPYSMRLAAAMQPLGGRLARDTRSLRTAAWLLQVISLGDRKVSQSGFVSLFSVANCVSRLLAGCVTDVLPTSPAD